MHSSATIRRAVLLLVALALHLSFAKVITIGVSTFRTEATFTFLEVEYGYRSFVKYFNEVYPPIYIGGERITFDLKILQDNNTAASVTQNYQQLLADPSVDFFFAGFNTANGNRAALVTEPAERLLLSSSATSDSYVVGRKHAYSTHPSYDVRVASTLPIARVGSAKNATIVRASRTLPPPVGEICNGMEETLARSGLIHLDTFYYDSTADATANWTTIAQAIVDRPADLIVYCGFIIDPARAMFDYWKNVDFMPKAVTASIEATSALLPDTIELTNYWIGGSLFLEDRDLKGSFIPSIISFDAWIDQTFPELIGRTSYGKGILHAAVQPGLVLLNTMLAINSTDRAAVRDAIGRSETKTYLGTFTFSADHRQLNPGISYQLVNGKSVIIGPISILEKEIIYPLPTWAERESPTGVYPVEIVFLVITCVCMVVSIGWIIYVFRAWNLKVITASSPIFLIIILVGSLFLYFSIVMWLPSWANDVTCTLRGWMVAVGFVIMFGSMIAKTWRIVRLIDNSTLKIYRVSNGHVALMVVSMLSIDVILLLAWSLTTPNMSQLVIVDEFRPLYNFQACASTTASSGIAWAIVAYNGLLFIYGAYLAWRVKSIPMKLYDESKMYNIGIVAIIVCVLESVGLPDRYVLFGVRSGLIILSTVVTINTLFISKRTQIISMSSKNSSTGISNAAMGAMPATTFNYSTEKKSEVSTGDESDKSRIKRLEKENAELRKRIAILTSEPLSEKQHNSERSGSVVLRADEAVEDPSSSDPKEDEAEQKDKKAKKEESEESDEEESEENASSTS